MQKSSIGLMAIALASGMCASVLAAPLNGGPVKAVGPGDWTQQWRQNRNILLDENPGLRHDPTSIIVKFFDGVSQEDKDVFYGLMEMRRIQKLGQTDLEHVAINDSAENMVFLAREIGAELGIVEFAELDHIAHLGATPNDSFYSLLWGMNNTGQTVNRDRGTANADIDANLAWDVWTGSSSFVVGVVDSGILLNHQDLAANIWVNPGEIAGNGIDDDGNGYVDDVNGWDFWNNDNNPTDDNGHGSHVAGTIGAVGNNGVGVVGVCWNVKLAGLKIGSASGSVSVTAAINAINYCIGKGIKVANHSWSGGAYNAALDSACTAARNAGHIIVAAAGNGGFDGRGDNNNTIPAYPASYTQDNIIAVAAIDNDNKLTTFSNYGSTSVDLGAPGKMIASCYNSATNSYVYLDGTSMAAPHVTGAVALVWSKNPTWTYSQVRSKILSTTKPLSSLSGKTVTGGCLNVNNAIR